MPQLHDYVDRLVMRWRQIHDRRIADTSTESALDGDQRAAHNAGLRASRFSQHWSKLAMLDRYFTIPGRIRHLRSSPLGSFLDGYASELHAAGYSLHTARCRIWDAIHLGVWLEQQRIKVAGVGDEVVARFDRHLSKCDCTGYRHTVYRRVPFSVRQFLDYLRRNGVVETHPSDPAPAEVVVAGYRDWMRRRRGLAETTVHRRGLLAATFVAAAGAEPSRYNAAAVRDFVSSHVRKHEPSATNVRTSIRGFLQYLVLQGHCSQELVAAVPKIPSARLAALPKYLTRDEVERIIASCQPTTPCGVRDRAIVLLVARLGLRPSDAVRLRLDDLDWRKSRVRVVGKGRRETRLPLPQDVGDAILDYLKRDRANTGDDHVFLGVYAPFAPVSTTVVSACVGRAMERAGVKTAQHGAYVLRHSLARQMLRDDATLDQIGAVLRHRRVETTAIYAKVDVDRLREIARRWPLPEDPSC